MHHWFLRHADGSALEGQPVDGFGGPGRAYLWLAAPERERFGRELFVIRDDGLRPLVGGRRES